MGWSAPMLHSDCFYRAELSKSCSKVHYAIPALGALGCSPNPMSLAQELAVLTFLGETLSQICQVDSTVSIAGIKVNLNLWRALEGQSCQFSKDFISCVSL